MPNLTEYQKKALNHKRHISLTANAGSGKTFVLARRFLSILLEENISLNRIIAITFTDKAASELYTKIAKEIEDRILTTDELSEKKKLISLRRELVSAKISTIHSFCTDILREFPTEAGIDANFIPIDKRVSDELISEAVDEVLLNSLKEGNAITEIVKKQIRLFGSTNALKSILTQSIHKRSTISLLQKNIYSGSVENISKHLSDIFSKYFREIFRDKIDDIINSIRTLNNHAKSVSTKTNELAEEVDLIIEKFNFHKELLKSISELNKLFKLITTSSGTIKKTGYLTSKNRGAVETEIELIELFYSDFKTINFSDEIEQTTKELSLFGKEFSLLAANIFETYSNKKMQKGYLDFEDLLLFSEMLVQRSDVKEYLAEKYEYFMIDEYQDTNETQFNIFIPILDYLKRGNLFIVGDDKQSIYMFRGADIQIFEKTKKIITNSDDGTLLELPHSFRLSPKLTLFTNHLFGNLFSEPKLIFNEVKYNELICAKENSDDGEIAFLISDNSIEENGSEFELVAKQILDLTQTKNISFGDIAILSRKRKSFAELEKVFSEWNIPYRIYGGKGFYQRQEIYDVYNYLSFLINPNNDEALVAILRSPFFMLSDKLIFETSKLNGNSFWEKTIRFSSSNDIVKSISTKLLLHIENSKSSSLSELIREILTSTNYYSKVLLKPDGDQIIQNLDKLLNTAIAFMSKGSVTIFDFVVYLRELIHRAEDESLATIEDSDDVVRMMTIHASKGLEFPVVFLIDTNSKGISDQVKSKSVAFDKELGILTKVPSKGYFTDYQTAPIVSLYNYIAEKKNIAELKRILYVAVTRAEKFLYISANSKIKKDGSRTIQNGSLLQLFNSGLELGSFDTPINLVKNQTFMYENNGEYKTKQELVTLRIDFIDNFKQEFQIETSGKGKFQNNFIVNKSMIKDTPDSEIVSATKISVFNQCPLKYHLIYNLGYTSLFYTQKEISKNIEFDKEDVFENNLPANIKGSIIHKVLENDEPIERLDENLEKLVYSATENFSSSEILLEINSIKKSLLEYYKSETYKKVQSYKTFHNEYEIYLKYKDFFLYGIIDKLVIENSKAVIIDYKTDSLQKYSPEEKLENYKYQLFFYAFLINKMFPSISDITCKLIFIEAPEKVAEINLSRKMLAEFGISMNSAINNMRHEEFIKNISHCKSCYFSDSNNNCVI